MLTQKPLLDRTALITGAACRLGRDCALTLARLGARVILHYNKSEKEAQNTLEEVSRHTTALALRADFADPEQATILFNKARDHFGSIDILLNSASIYHNSSLQDCSLIDLEQNQLVHVWAPLVLSRLCIAQKAQPTQGTIINILDTRIKDYDKSHFAYHLSKQALFSLTRMLAVEAAPRFSVNALAPGLILPPVDAEPGYMEKYRQYNLLQKSGSTQDITHALTFLVTSAFITGQVLFIDGGRHLKGSFYGT